MLGYYSLHGREKVKTLTQSEFESQLTRHQVIKLVLSDDGNGVVRHLSGMLQEKGTAQQIQFTTQVIYTDALDALIRQYAPIYEARSESNTFTNLVYMLLPTVLLIAFFYFIFSRQMRANGPGGITFGKSRARRVEPGKNPITFQDVAGCEEAKEEMQEFVDFLKDPQSFSRLGAHVPHGALLVGPPGTGKTLLAKAIAGESSAAFYSISGSDFVEMCVGVGASRVRDMFEEAKKNTPALIFIDEIDAVGRQRGTGIGGGHDEREQTLNALLVEMDGFDTNQGVIVLAATNRADVLDSALLRPGRFDRQVVVPLPDLRGRLAILKVHARKTKLADDVDLRIIARATAGFSGADLANMINEAALLATRRKLDAVGMPELEEARDKVSWGRERKSHRMDDKERRLTAYHEGGHALVGLFCENATPLHKITIIPRGNALGATMYIPEGDINGFTRNELLDRIAVSFGGRAAEELVLDDISTGASQDIHQATEIARQMVCKWGMSDKLGTIDYVGHEEHLYLGRDITRTEGFSPETAREIDLEIRRIIYEQKSRATNILTEHRDLLEKLAQALLERETLTAHEVYELLGLPEPPSRRSPADLAHDFDDPIEEALQAQDEGLDDSLPSTPEPGNQSADGKLGTPPMASAPKHPLPPMAPPPKDLPEKPSSSTDKTNPPQAPPS
ncbi:MAG: ATP-dependent zinc metalloprotease FtsH [Victivallales bacterium]|nr:ATP-dependent zinc metalloprotease FtsH [Victivallales bacterium]